MQAFHKPDVPALTFLTASNVNEPCSLEQLAGWTQAGLGAIKLRVQGVSFERMAFQAEKIKKILSSFKIFLIINDFPEITCRMGANGVHWGGVKATATLTRRA